MTPEQKQVKEFMQVFGQECPEKPTMPSLEIRKLRAKLILEEALETIQKGLGLSVQVRDKLDKELLMIQLDDQGLLEYEFIENELLRPSLVELADGLADLHYVAYCGTAIACGLDMEPIFAEVHRSNMTKLWTWMEICITSIDKNTHTYKPVFEKEPENRRMYLVKNKDGKVIKSPSYSPANLRPIIEEQQKS